MIGQQIVSEVDARLKAMGTEILQIKSSPAAAASSNTAQPGQGSVHDVVSPKDCPVGKLSDDATVGDFRHWCESVENHLESHRTWKGPGALLRAIRRHPTVIDLTASNNICVQSCGLIKD